MVKRRAGNREQQRRRAAALPPEHSGTGSDPLTDSARKSLITQRAAALQRLESGRWARNRRKADAGPADATKRGPRKADGKRTRAASDPGLSRSARNRVQARPARAQHRPRVHADRRAPVRMHARAMLCPRGARLNSISRRPGQPGVARGSSPLPVGLPRPAFGRVGRPGVGLATIARPSAGFQSLKRRSALRDERFSRGISERITARAGVLRW